MSVNKPLRVLQIGMTWNVGGIETYLMEQFRHLDKNKIVYDFVNLDDSHDIAFQKEIINMGGRVYAICQRHKNPIRHYFQWIRLLYKTSNLYKAIVLNSLSMGYIFPIFIARFFGIPIRIVHSHNSGIEESISFKKKILFSVNRYLMKFSATDYFACSSLAGKWMFGQVGSFKIIPNSIKIDKFLLNDNTRSQIRRKNRWVGKFLIGHVGRFSFQKNQLFLIDIFKAYHSINKNSMLLLIGDGSNTNFPYMERVKEKVKEYKLNEFVEFLGMRDDVPDLMQAMDCFVLPSNFEGLPVVGIEAQAAGLPCFFSNVITKEVRVTDLVTFVSLKDNPDKWAMSIHDSEKIKRINQLHMIQQAGYDITATISWIENYYLR